MEPSEPDRCLRLTEAAATTVIDIEAILSAYRVDERPDPWFDEIARGNLRAAATRLRRALAPDNDQCHA